MANRRCLASLEAEVAMLRAENTALRDLLANMPPEA
jgi:hypothetical protein